MNLAELQRAFARRVLAGDDAILPEIRDNARTDRTVLMHVYEHAYGARLAEVLEGDYEKLLAALGRDGFLEMAAAYVRERPSDDPNARYFGRRLPAFLAGTPPWSETPWLAELAALEWAMGEVFQAEDPPRLAIEAMAALHPQDWPWLRFQMAPDARRLTTRHGGPEAWLALNQDADPAPAAEAAAGETAEWLVWRNDDTASFRAMHAPEAWAYDRAAAGALFAELCEGLTEWSPAHEAATLMAGYLRGWLESGLVSGYEVDEAATGEG